MDGDRDHVDRMVEAWAASDPDLDASPLEVAGRLLRGAALLEREIEAALHDLGLSFGDFDVVNTLRRRADPGGTNPKVLAASALVTTGAMTTRLHRLERAGLIERHPDPADGRAVRVRLTAAGQDRARAALAAVLDADRRFLAPLTSDDHATLAAGLRRLLLHADPPERGTTRSELAEGGA
jgi:DNA-binding MarR family transcriptional regulator